jgi:hypothetical protein
MLTYRKLRPVMVVWVAAMFWSSGTAMAFTLQFGPDAPTDVVNDGHTTYGADVPTPQLFRVVIGPTEATSGTASLTTVYPVTSPAMQVQIVRPAPAVQGSGASATIVRSLSGAELLLLRQTHTVAEENQGQRQGGVKD